MQDERAKTQLRQELEQITKCFEEQGVIMVFGDYFDTCRVFTARFSPPDFDVPLVTIWDSYEDAIDGLANELIEHRLIRALDNKLFESLYAGISSIGF